MVYNRTIILRRNIPIQLFERNVAVVRNKFIFAFFFFFCIYKLKVSTFDNLDWEGGVRRSGEPIEFTICDSLRL
jgi:hypothetical protein